MIENDFIKNYEILPIAYHEASFLCANQNNAQNTMHTSLHKHNELEIFYVKEGGSYMCVGGIHYELNEGDILIINPLESHYGEYYGNQTKYAYYCVDFDVSLLKIEMQHVRFQNHIPKSHPQNKDLSELLNDILNCLREKQTGWEWRLSGDLLIFNAILIENNLALTNDQSPCKSSNNVFINQILEYIEENYDKNVTSNDIAEELSYNHCYFCRLFKNTFNKPFGEYLNIYRLCVARDLLESTTKSVTEIATLTGFNNNSYFSKLFKNYFGCSPLEYRKQHSHKK